MANITSTVTTYDREKFLASKLVARASQRLVCSGLCDKVDQPEGTGLTAYFVRYKRMYIPQTVLAEGTDPSAASDFSLEQFTVTMDQWGDFVVITDLAELTTKHPLVQQALALLADNAQRVIDREIQLVWLANTNILYGDGTVTTRATITSTMVMSNTILHKARVTLVAAGALPKNGPSYEQKVGGTGSIAQGAAFVAVCGPEVLADLMATSTSFGSWVSAAAYANQKALYNYEQGTWLGFRFVETNFAPRYFRLGNNTAAVATGNAFGTDTPVVSTVSGGGTLTSGTTYYFKVTRFSLYDGFEDDISIEHTMVSAAAGNDEVFTFNYSSLTAGYKYYTYFGSSSGITNLKLYSATPAAVGDTVTIGTVPVLTTTAPSDVGVAASAAIGVFPVYILADNACNWVGLQDLKMLMSKPGEVTYSNPLALRRTLGYKFSCKAIIPDTTRLLKLEVASMYSTS